jgi:DNA-binding FadR family transcriptional regulator
MSSHSTLTIQHPSLATKGHGLQRRGGLVHEVVLQLQQQIHSGAIKPGDKLPTESAFMLSLGVSRTVIREAISQLQAAKQVETRHGIGTFVLAPSAAKNFQIDEEVLSKLDDVIGVLELRIGIETEAAGLAAQRAKSSHIKALKLSLQSFLNAIQTDSDAVPSDFEFHMGIAKATGNQYFEDLLSYLGTHIIPRTRINTTDLGSEGTALYLQRVHSEHVEIFEAIRQHDTNGARQAMHRHLTNSCSRLRKARDGAH